MSRAVIELTGIDGVISVGVDAMARAVCCQRPFSAAAYGAAGKTAVADAAMVFVARVMAFVNVCHGLFLSRIDGGGFIVWVERSEVIGGVGVFEDCWVVGGAFAGFARGADVSAENAVSIDQVVTRQSRSAGAWLRHGIDPSKRR